MAQLKPQIISASNQAGDRLELSFAASVSDGGTFKLRLPETLAADTNFFDALGRARRAAPESITGWTKERVNTYIEGKALLPLVMAVKSAMQDYITVETKRELVIVYGTDLKVSFWINPDGTISQNGNTGDKGGSWNRSKAFGDLHATNQVAAYRVGLYARVWERVTHTRGESARVTYDYVSDNNEDEAIAELNAFSALSIDRSSIDRNDVRGVSLVSMPYSPEAAMFFTRMLLSVCDLARRIHSFFGDADQLQLAIKTGAPLLPAPANKPTEE